jgi:hypothetical protein
MFKFFIESIDDDESRARPNVSDLCPTFVVTGWFRGGSVCTMQHACSLDHALAFSPSHLRSYGVSVEGMDYPDQTVTPVFHLFSGARLSGGSGWGCTRQRSAEVGATHS